MLGIWGLVKHQVFAGDLTNLSINNGGLINGSVMIVCTIFFGMNSHNSPILWCETIWYKGFEPKPHNYIMGYDWNSGIALVFWWTIFH